MVLKNQDWVKRISDIKEVGRIQEPYLSLNINGKGARIYQTQKFTALMNGCLFIIGDWDKLKPKDEFYFERVMPEIEIIIRDDVGNEIGRRDVKGFTNDPRVVQIWLDVFGGKIANRKIRKSLKELGYKLPDYIY